MNNIIKIIVLVLFNLSLSAQEQVVPIEDWQDYNEQDDTVYYFKDLNNELNKFTGTWLYQNGTTSFEITFIKAEHVEDGFGNYSDILTSNFKYIDNGNIVYDSNTISYDVDYFNGGSFITANGTNSLSFMYSEPDVPFELLTGDLKISYNNSSSNETLSWTVNYFSKPHVTQSFKIPMSMTLIKQ